MDFDLYRKVVDEAVKLGIGHVRVHNYGEPFLDRELVEKVRYAKQAGIPVTFLVTSFQFPPPSLVYQRSA